MLFILYTDISNSEFQPGKKAFYMENDELKLKTNHKNKIITI